MADQHASGEVRVVLGGLDLYVHEVLRLEPLDAEQLLQLRTTADQGDQHARDQLVVRHLGLVVRAVQHRHPARANLLDLLETGNRALIQGIAECRTPDAGAWYSHLGDCVENALDGVML